jgi:hypothetical protein
MANALHASFKGFLLDGGYNLGSATIKIDLIDAADITIDPATHDFYDDISAGVVATATLASVTTSSAGVLDSADPTFSAVTGDQSEEIEMWIDTGGASSTDPLVANYDTFSSGMPVTPNGGDIEVTVNASGWFAL